jgi:hypothetical protein
LWNEFFFRAPQLRRDPLGGFELTAIYQSRSKVWLGAILLVVGLLGHLLAAHAMGGSRLAYIHHVLGFMLIFLVSAAIVAGLGWRFWRGRADITILTVGAIQALLGITVYLMQAVA